MQGAAENLQFDSKGAHSHAEHHHSHGIGQNNVHAADYGVCQIKEAQLCNDAAEARHQHGEQQKNPLNSDRRNHETNLEYFSTLRILCELCGLCG